MRLPVIVRLSAAGSVSKNGKCMGRKMQNGFYILVGRWLNSAGMRIMARMQESLIGMRIMRLPMIMRISAASSAYMILKEYKNHASWQNINNASQVLVGKPKILRQISRL